jgi:hypothetical protein
LMSFSDPFFPRLSQTFCRASVFPGRESVVLCRESVWTIEAISYIFFLSRLSQTKPMFSNPLSKRSSRILRS